MKPSRRNKKIVATKAAARLGGPPKVSKYAAKVQRETRGVKRDMPSPHQ